MDGLITGRRLEVTPALRQFVEGRVKRLDEYMGMADKAAVVLNVEKSRHLAEVSVRVNGRLLQAREESGERYASINRAAEKIFKQFRKTKEKISRRPSRPEPEGTWAEEPTAPPSTRRPVAALPPTLREARRKIVSHPDDLPVFSDPSNRQIGILRRHGNGELELLFRVS